MSNTVDQVKNRLSIIDVVSSYIAISPSGKQYKACCPFHQEKTPSFHLSVERNTYHCFGCGKGGDIFSFVQEMEGLSFPEALAQLANRAGVVITHNEHDNGRIKVLYNALNDATEYFISNVNENIIFYLKERGINEESIKNFKIGFALDEWRGVIDFLRSKNYSDSVIVDIGLAIKVEKPARPGETSGGGIYDRFRGRILFPISDAQGRIVAFSGRILPELQSSGKTVGKTPAKYVNSPETELFHKSDILYGYDMAKQAMRVKNRAILVEGQMDLVMAHQAGYTETVAVSGTALTDSHLRLLKRFTEKIIFCFDSDEAGIKASEKSFTLALKQGMDVSIAELPKGMDPADVIKNDKENFAKAIENSKHIVLFMLSLGKINHTDLRSFRLYVNERVLPFIRMINKSMDQAHFVNIVARAVDLTDRTIAEALREIPANDIDYNKETINNQKSPEKNSIQKIIDFERTMLGLMLWNIEGNPEIPIHEVDTMLTHYLDTNSERVIEEISYDKNVLVSEVEFRYHDRSHIPVELKEAIINTALTRLGDKAISLKMEMNQNEDIELVRQYQEVKKKLDLVKHDRNQV